MTRLVSGLTLALGALALVWWLSSAQLLGVAVVVAALAFHEYARLARGVGAPLPYAPGARRHARDVRSGDAVVGGPAIAAGPHAGGGRGVAHGWRPARRRVVSRGVGRNARAAVHWTAARRAGRHPRAGRTRRRVVDHGDGGGQRHVPVLHRACVRPATAGRDHQPEEDDRGRHRRAGAGADRAGRDYTLVAAAAAAGRRLGGGARHRRRRHRRRSVRIVAETRRRGEGQLAS